MGVDVDNSDAKLLSDSAESEDKFVSKYSRLPTKSSPKTAIILRLITLRNTSYLLLLLSGCIGSAVISASAPVWYLATPSWRFTLPGIEHPGSQKQAAFTFSLGIVLLLFGWIALVWFARTFQGKESRRILMVVLAASFWAAPVLLAPPLLSNDVYSYAAQGEVASRGMDPTEHGPEVLESGEFLTAADPIWRDAPAPYGPVAVEIGKQVVEITGHNAAAAVWGFRFVMLVSVILSGFGMAIYAKKRGVSPAVAIAFGLVNPIVILHFLGGIHNDAIMFAFVAGSLGCWSRGRKILAWGLATLAVGVKLPAIFVLVFLLWAWHGDTASFWKRVSSVCIGMLGSITVLASMCWAVGIKYGWITALQNTGKVKSTLSIMTKFGIFWQQNFLDPIGVDVFGQNFYSDTPIEIARLLGLGISAVLIVIILLQSHRIGLSQSIGLSLLTTIMLGPVVWPWYLPAAFALLAVGGLGRWRDSVGVLVIGTSLLVWPTSVGPVSELTNKQHWLGLFAILFFFWLAFIVRKEDEPDLLDRVHS